MKISELSEKLKSVEGWLTDGEGELLYNLAKECSGRGVIVEIGSWKGKSTICLALGSKNGSNVIIHAIDPHTGSPEIREQYGDVWSFDEFKQNIQKAQVDDIIVPIVATSEEAAKQFGAPVELIFIDGAHEYDSVKLDYELWFHKLINGGIMVFHDSTCVPGPKQVVEEVIYNSSRFRNVGVVDKITYAQKVECSSVTDRLRSQYVRALTHPDEFADRLHLPKPLRSLGKKIIKPH